MNRAVGRDKDEMNKGSVTELRQSIAIDPKMQVLIVHGWDDLSCPFMASKSDRRPDAGDG